VVLYGRDAERAEIGALLDAARDLRSSALVVRGEPGIGKTALLADARERAQDMHVLAARGVESEAELPFAALHQLVRPALDQLPQLPAPQAAALSGALGLGNGTAYEPFLVYAGCLSLLAEMAERRPLLCIIDDAHWLDTGSADALLFVARRLDAEGIVMLFGARQDDVRTFEAPGIPALTLGALDADAAGAILTRDAGEAAPPVRERLIEQARGNPLALVELPSALTQAQLAGTEALPELLPLTRQVENVFLDRVRRLPDEAQHLLVVAAAEDAGDAGLVCRAAELLGTGASGLNAIEQAGLVVVQGTRLEFRHPLVRSAVYEAATSNERRAAHGALAEALAELDEQADSRAWHLVAAALQPDESVVRALDEAAGRAEGRGGYMTAAKAFARAAELSDDRSERGRRLVDASRNLSLAGRDDRALEATTQADRVVDDPLLRAELAHVRAVAALRRGHPGEVVPLVVAAARDVAPVQPAKAIDLLVDATSAAWQGGDEAAYLDAARLAETVVPPEDDEAATIMGRSLAGFAALLKGDTDTGVANLNELAAWGERATAAQQVVWASFGAIWLDDQQRFAALLDRAISLARKRGELGTLVEALGIRAVQVAIAQDFDGAAIAATEAVRFARELDAENLEFVPLGTLALVAAIRGRVEEALRSGERVLERAPPRGLRLRASTAIWALALVELGRQRWSDALQRLEELEDSMDPAVALTIPDRIEAAVRAGRTDEAQAALPRFEAWAGYSGSPSAPAQLAACRALLATGEEATRHFEAAIGVVGAARPFDRARIQLLYGEHLRRERRRVDARAQLRTALEGFDRLRAEPWAERARTELRASGEKARKRDPSTVDELTPQEIQIARLVAGGLSNKEVAAQLFLSPRTIDYHLRNVFSKLGITSRTQLARLPLADEPTEAPAATVPA
jgi:DNA-binding CsgD family transcriptional regulator